jgi:uncharacterized lipoprotein YmbA
MDAGRNRRRSARTPILGLLAAAVLLSGCGVIPRLREDRTRFYSLTTPEAEMRQPQEGAARFLVRRVELPAYLQGSKAIAIRRNVTEIEFLDQDWWSEPLDLGIARVFRENLAQRGFFATDRASEAYDLELVVYIRRFEGEIRDDDADVRMLATVEMHRPGREGTPPRRSIGPDPIPWDGRDVSEMVAALSALVTELAVTVSL